MSRKKDKPFGPAEQDTYAPKSSALLSGDEQGTEINLHTPMKHYLGKRHDKLCEWMLEVMQHFRTALNPQVDQDLLTPLDLVVSNILYYLTKPDFVIPASYHKTFLKNHQLLADMISVSSFRNADTQIRLLKDQPNAWFKIMLLASAYNSEPIDRRWLFDQNPSLASMWYVMYFGAAVSPHSETVFANLRAHQEYLDDRLELSGPAAASILFYTTYINPDTELPLRKRINELIQDKLRKQTIRNTPDKRKIAIVSDRWFWPSAVYRAYGPLVQSLKDDYDLTLIHTSDMRDNLDTDMFEKVINLRMKPNGVVDVSGIQTNEFAMVFFPDIGFTPESVHLSNLRIAPIQMTTYGHPTSTGGSQIDYYFAGTDTEPEDNPEKNYSERLIMVPGRAAALSIPDYTPTNAAKETDAIVITCAWSPCKYNHPLLLTMKEVLQRTSRKVIIQLLPELFLLQRGGFSRFKRDVTELLGAENTRIEAVTRDAYMQALERSDFSVDSFPFGGASTVVDALLVHKPIVTWKGQRCYNMAASYILEDVGLAELAAQNREDYINRILHLIEDDTYRQTITERIEKMDLAAALDDTKTPELFKKAVDFVIENHDSMRQSADRVAIHIEA